MMTEQQNSTDSGAANPTQRMAATPAARPPEEGLTPPPSGGDEGGFWATASGGVKAAIIIGAIVLIGLLLWGLSSMIGGGNTPPEPPITPIPTTAAPTAEAGAPTLTASRDTGIYAGPGVDYPQIGTLQSGLGAEVVGSNQDKSWWAIKFPAGPNGNGWVANADVTTQGVDNVPVIQAPPLPTATPVVITDWKGEYFANPNVDGKPELVRNDQAINFDWGNGAPVPGLPTDNYSVRWSRKANFENSDYLFTVTVEGGVRLWLDGRMLIDDWAAGGNRTLTAQSGVINAGDHDLRVDYFKSGGAGRISVKWEPIATPAPVAVIDIPGPITVGQPVQFSSQRSTAADGHSIVTFQWDFGDGSGSNDANPVYTYSNPGDYTVTLTVIDDLGQKGESKAGVTVQAPAPPVAVIGGPKSGQAGDTLAYSGSDSQSSLPITRYDWDFGDGITAQGANVNHVYQNAGAYRITLTVTDEAGQQGSSALDVTITGAPLPTETPAPQPTVGPTATPPGQEILGAWRLISRAQGRQAPIEVLPDTEITLVLAADGSYSGNGGCNDYQGLYQLTQPDQITFGPMTQSQKACDQPIMAQETEYFTLLPKVESFTVSGNKMQLLTSDNWTLFFSRNP